MSRAPQGPAGPWGILQGKFDGAGKQAMARMWRGPCAALKAAEADPLWAAIHRRNGRIGVFCTVANDGRSASFYSISKSRGEFYQHDLGQAEGADPYLAVLHGSHTFTGYDAELIQLHHEYLARLAEEIDVDCLMIAGKLKAAADAFLP